MQSTLRAGCAARGGDEEPLHGRPGGTAVRRCPDEAPPHPLWRPAAKELPQQGQPTNAFAASTASYAPGSSPAYSVAKTNPLQMVALIAGDLI